MILWAWLLSSFPGGPHAKKLAANVSADQSQHSVSFNEFLTLCGRKNTDHTEILREVLEMFDMEKTGKITEDVFRYLPFNFTKTSLSIEFRNYVVFENAQPSIKLELLIV